MALRLIIEDEEGATTIVPLTEQEITIGREPGNTIQLTEQNVSRQHARLTLSPDGWILEDLESYNGIKVNNVQVENSVNLLEGDLVQIGDYHLALSEKVDVTTLNLERDADNTPVDHEPFTATPSVDLPRIPESELESLHPATLPMPTATASVADLSPGRDEVEDEDEDKGGGGLGKILAIAVVLVLLVGGGVYFAMGSNQGGPEKDPGKAVAASGDSGQGASAANPDVGGPAEAKASEPDAGSDTGEDSAAEESAAPESAAPESGDESGEESGEESGADDSSAPESGEEDSGEEDSGEEDSGEEPTKAPSKKKVVKPQGNPTQLLNEARQASLARDYAKAFRLAKQSYGIDHNADALKIMGVSACNLADARKAKAAYRKLRGKAKSDVAKLCSLKGIQLE